MITYKKINEMFKIMHYSISVNSAIFIFSSKTYFNPRHIIEMRFFNQLNFSYHNIKKIRKKNIFVKLESKLSNVRMLTEKMAYIFFL